MGYPGHDCSLEDMVLDNMQMLELAQRHNVDYILIEDKYEIELERYYK